MEVFTEDGLGLFDAFALGTFGAGAEEFACAGLEEALGGQFGGFAGEPDPLGGLKDRGMAEAFDEAGEFESAGIQEFRQRSGGLTGQDVANGGVEGIGYFSELSGEEGGGEFDGEELVTLGGFTGGAERGGTGDVEGEGTGAELDFALGIADGTEAGEVEAEFDTSGVETAGPIELVVEAEVMPFDAESEVGEAGEEGLPAGGHGFPGWGFDKGRVKGWGRPGFGVGRWGRHVRRMAGRAGPGMGLVSRGG